MAQENIEWTPEQVIQMETSMQQLQAIKKKMIQNTVIVIILLVIAFFYNYKSDYEYSWAYALFLHSWIAVPEWLLAFFIDGKAAKPELCTSAYNVIWWINFIGGILWFVMRFIIAPISVFVTNKLLAEYKEFRAQNIDYVAQCIAAAQNAQPADSNADAQQ